VTLNGRMTVTAAIAVVLASTVMYPLFTDSVWFAISIGAVIAVAGAGALSRLRFLPVSVSMAADVAGLLLYLNLVFEARRSWLYVVPTAASASRLWHLIGTGLTDTHHHAPPVPNLPGLLLLAAGGTGITAVATDLIAVRLRSAALAGLPLLVLFTVPVMLNPPHSQLTTPLVFCLGGAGYLAMLSADGRERIRVWGRLVSLWRAGSGRGAPEHGGPDTRALAAAGRRVGLASIVLALCAPLLIPGLHPSKWFASGPGTGGTGGGTVIGLPDVLSGTITELRGRPSTVLTYTTTAPRSLQAGDPQYLHQYVFDTLTDSGWVPDAYPRDAARLGAIPPEPGLDSTPSARPVTETMHTAPDFMISDSLPVFLPVPYPPTSVTPGTWMVDPDLMVYSGGSSIANQTYTVTSLDVDPTAAQLSDAPLPAQNMSADVQLPRSYQLPALENLAAAITTGQHTEYAKADALAIWLADEGSYDARAPAFHDAAGLVTFLTKARNGVCVQFAWAMTVLARLLGIPARVVSGFTAGTPTTRDHYVVTTKDGHAWTEVYFQGYGWIRFEPTPSGQGTANTPNYMAAPRTGTGHLVNPVVLPSSGAGTNPATGKPKPKFPGAPLPPGEGGPAGPASGGPGGMPWAAAVVLAVIAAGAVMLIAPSLSRLARRRWRWIHATDDTSRAHAAWREFHDDLADYGIGWRPSEPPRALAGRITAGLPEPAADAVRRLALAEERASYAARPAGSANLRRDSTAARRALAASARRSTRWRARIFPASLRPGRLHPAVALLTAAPAFFHPFHHPGPSGQSRPAGAGRPAGACGPGLLGLAARGAYPGRMPAPADDRPHQGEQHDRCPGPLEIQVVGDYPGRDEAGADHHADQALRQLALIVHTRIA
jgi:transglutaminase-like putative cysteine protease